MSTKQHAPVRERLTRDRVGVTHQFSIGGHEGVLRTGLYPDGRLGEVFLKVSKSGSTLSGMMDAFATVVSIALQYGVPLEVLCDKFVGYRFEPNGFTHNTDIPQASSILDYVFRYLQEQHGTKRDEEDG